LVGATTMFGKISSPLEGRFGIIIKLKNYDIKTLKEIVSSSCEKLNLKLTEEEIETIASNSKLIPRNANRIVRRVHDFRTNDEKITIDEILVKLNIGKNGLDTTDLEYLSILKEHNCSVGIKTLSSILNVDVNTVETKIEPFLLFCGYIIKSSKGRNISIRGLQFMLNSNNVQTEFKNELFA
jgi:Holliday junction DNA helicase RuvB